ISLSPTGGRYPKGRKSLDRNGTRSSAEKSETRENATELDRSKIRVNHLIGISSAQSNGIPTLTGRRLRSCRRLAPVCPPTPRRHSSAIRQQLAAPRLARERRLAASGGYQTPRRKHFRVQPSRRCSLRVASRAPPQPRLLRSNNLQGHRAPSRPCRGGERNPCRSGRMEDGPRSCNANYAWRCHRLR